MDFSIVITTKNRLDFLQRAIKSIAANTLTPSEIVIVNDGGDNIENEIFSYLNIKLTIINLIYSKGANYARNLGIKETTNDIVFLLDDDDAVTTSSFESRISAFSDKNIGISFTGIQIVDDINLNVVKRIVNKIDITPTQENLLTLGNIIGSTSRVALRKSYFNQSGKFDEALPCLQDYDLWIRMAEVADISYDHNAGVLYTVHTKKKKKSQISQNYKKYISSTNYLINKYSSQLKNKKNKEEIFI